MNTKIRIALWALVVAAPAWTAVGAADPVSPSPPGRVLILENERILEGDIEREGDQYRIHRLVGETWVPADQVLCLCPNMEEAYVFLRGRANLRDPDERLRLARWCQLHGLRSQALDEVTAAVHLRPQHRDSLQLLRCLQRSVTVSHPAPAAAVADRTDPGTTASPSLDLSTQALGVFTSRVQPILMNTCASCHAAGRGGSFNLVRVFSDDRTNRRAIQQNLAAVLAEINRERPSASPLLTRAVSVHGDADPPPLKGRQTAAYRILEDWVQLAVTDAQPPEGSSSVVVLPAPEARPFVETVPKAEPLARGTTSLPGGTPSGQASSPPTPAPAGPAAAPPDPFDPGVFNRQMHPSPGTGN